MAGMEIMNEDAHRLLTYVEAARRQGHALTEDEFQAYANGWEQMIVFSAGDPLLTSSYETYRRLMDATSPASQRRRETIIEFLYRVRWLDKSGGGIDITPLGKAILREANAPLPDSATASTLEVVINPTDPFAYAQLIMKIAGLGDCLVVDPYLDSQQLITLARVQNVSRILTSDYGLKDKSSEFGVLLDAAPHLSLRTLGGKKLHDRLLIPNYGSVYALGSSLNSIARRFGVVTTLEESSSDLIRRHYDNLWSEGLILERNAVSEEGVQ